MSSVLESGDLGCGTTTTEEESSENETPAKKRKGDNHGAKSSNQRKGQRSEGKGRGGRSGTKSEDRGSSGQDFWRLVDICLLNAWIIYKSTYPESKIRSNRIFCLKVVELVQPLLTLRSSPTCPPHLRTKGREPVSAEARLIGKHFPYKNMKRQRCVLCSQAQSSTTKKRSDKQDI